MKFKEKVTFKHIVCSNMTHIEMKKKMQLELGSIGKSS